MSAIHVCILTTHHSGSIQGRRNSAKLSCKHPGLWLPGELPYAVQAPERPTGKDMCLEEFSSAGVWEAGGMGGKAGWEPFERTGRWV